jgi:hypothetical protein
MKQLSVVLLSLLLSAALLLPACGHSKPEREKEGHPKAERQKENWRWCRIALEVAEGIQWQLIVDDRKQVEKIVGAPLRAARIDPKPADYRSLGDLVLADDDGKEESI